MDDYGLAPSYLAIITKAIQDQLSDYKAHSAALLDEGEAPSVPEDVLVKGGLDGEDDEWWTTWRTAVRNPAFAKFADEKEVHHSRKRRKVVKDEVTEPLVLPLKDQPMSVEEFDEDESLTVEEMRILIKVCIEYSYVAKSHTEFCSSISLSERSTLKIRSSGILIARIPHRNSLLRCTPKTSALAESSSKLGYFVILDLLLTGV